MKYFAGYPISSTPQADRERGYCSAFIEDSWYMHHNCSISWFLSALKDFSSRRFRTFLGGSSLIAPFWASDSMEPTSTPLPPVPESLINKEWNMEIGAGEFQARQEKCDQISLTDGAGEELVQIFNVALNAAMGLFSAPTTTTSRISSSLTRSTLIHSTFEFVSFVGSKLGEAVTHFSFFLAGWRR